MDDRSVPEPEGDDWDYDDWDSIERRIRSLLTPEELEIRRQSIEGIIKLSLMLDAEPPRA